jgi:hypothetical protein
MHHPAFFRIHYHQDAGDRGINRIPDGPRKDSLASNRT